MPIKGIVNYLEDILTFYISTRLALLNKYFNASTYNPHPFLDLRNTVDFISLSTPLLAFYKDFFIALTCVNLFLDHCF